jgi:heptosyltransferase-2|tara:strand:- start:1080 stop:2111 length:1032 start_codon:yes stop_codon:yes gene_type:complete
MNQNIFVVYPSGKLGDFIWHVPFIKHISDISHKRVILITRKSSSAQDILANEDYIENIHFILFKKGFLNYLKDILLMRKLFKKFNAKEVWILDKISRPAIAAKLANIKIINGFGASNQSLWITNKNYLSKRDLKIHYIERSIKFFNLIKKPINYEFTNINVSTDLTNTLKKKLKINEEKIITYGIDSSEMWRSWPKEYFAELILRIDKDDNFKHILIAGPQNSELAEDIIKKINLRNVFNYSHLKIKNIMPILKITNIYIGNDSGILNLSAAIGTKSIGIFSATKSFNYSDNIIPVISTEGEISDTTDRLLDNNGKTIEDPKLAIRVSVEDVYKKFKEIFILQ